MTIVAYLEQVKAHLIASPIVTSMQVVKAREETMDGHLRIRLTLTDDSLLEFSEYLVRQPDETITVAVYSYHWADAERKLIRRWDNAPHYPELPGAPHHIHDGAEANVMPGKPMDIYQILAIIGMEIR